MVKKILSFADTFKAATQPDLAVPGGMFVRPAPTTVNGLVTWADVDGYELLSPPATLDPSGNLIIDGYLITGSTIQTGGSITVGGSVTVAAGQGGELSETVSSVLVITGADYLLKDATIEVTRATGAQSGYLHVDDFNIFNNKLSNPLTTAGDLIYSSAGSTPARLAIGSPLQVLRVSAGGALQWTAPTNIGFPDPMTTAGDIIIRDAYNQTTRLGIGAEAQVLSVVSGIPTWQANPAGFADPMTTRGDIIVRNSSNLTARLGLGANGQFLKSDGSDIVWAYPDVNVINGGNTTGAALVVGTNDAQNLVLETANTTRLTISQIDIVSTLPLAATSLQAAAGSVSAPSFAFSTDPNTGIYSVGADSIGLATNGINRLTIDTSSVASTLNVTTTGVFLASAGSVSAPSFAFSSDPNTGIYSSGADAIVIATGGVAALEISSQQRVNFTGQAVSARHDAGNSSTAISVNWDNSNSQKVSLTANTTITLTNAQSGGWYTLEIIQGSSNYGITFSPVPKWQEGVVYVPSTTNGAKDIISFYFDGTNFNGSFGKGFA